MMPENLFQLAVKPSDITMGISMTEEKAIYTSIRSLIITIGGRARKKRRRMSWDRGGECSSKKKRVLVLIDRTARAEQAMVWALTHVANKGDLVTLLHVLPPHCSGSAHREEETSRLIDSLGSICKAIRPQAISSPPLHVLRHHLAVALSGIHICLCSGESGGVGDPRAQAGHGSRPSQEARRLCSGAEAKQAVSGLLVTP
ncbi:unnamed protein product [Musa textilis]